MKNFARLLTTSSAVALGVLAAGAAAQDSSTANLIFAVDESGSMAGEHNFLSGFASDVDTALSGSGFSTVNFGLTGYGGGGSGNLGRTIDVDGALFGDAASFATATGNLVTSGSDEDGWAAIDFVLNTYTIPSGESTTIILVTDEPRIPEVPALSYGDVEADLDAAGVNLISVVDARFEDATGTEAIATDGATAYVQDGTGFTTAPFGSVTGADGSTEADYIDLAFSTPNGCAATLNELRDGGDAATAFSAVLLECLTIAASGGGGTQTVPLNQYRDTTKTVMDNHRAQVRRMAYGIGVDFASEGAQVSMSTRDQSTAFDMGGLRGYFAVTGYQGEIDAFENNAGLDYDGRGFILGIDRTGDHAAGHLRYGMSLGFDSIGADLEASQGSLDTESTTLQVYAAYRQAEGPYALGHMQFALHDFTNTRIDGGTSHVGTPDGRSFGTEVETGYGMTPIALGDDGPGAAMLQMTPFAAIGYERHAVDGYTESNNGVTVADFDEDAVYARAGLRSEFDVTHAGTRFYGALEISATDRLDGETRAVPLNGGLDSAVITSGDDRRVDVRFETGAEINENSRVFLNLDGGYSDHAEQYAATAGFEMRF
ncbi:autotransporter domain-containing protein [Salibaculum sp.]|uniref:autotransporter domain-containing protein n=1 Tax=Salibaculum sp. TaxID=2855480 RepID=UPI002B4826A0|nr:autotransporter domain-containing protein [Salibaculum sp.]HKL69206.1 autotransporter domain-containing protein [Salibaculum sp.]